MAIDPSLSLGSRTGSFPFLSLDLCLSIVLFISLFVFWLTPGGFAWALYKARVHTRQQSKARAAIPGPAGLPIIGLLLAFVNNASTHRILASIANSCNAKALMAFSVGSTRFVITSEPETAKELLNSSAFADRPLNESAYELLFHRSMGFAPFGDYWRELRRISSTHLFSPKRISGFAESRRKIGNSMVEDINSAMASYGEVEIRRILHFGSLNNVMSTVFGRTFYFNDGTNELEHFVSEGYELLGIFNWGDHFPGARWLDLQGVRRRCRSLVGKVNVFVGNIIDDHISKRSLHDSQEEESTNEDDFVDVLLGMQGNSKLSNSDMIAVLWEMIFRGTDTVAILLEWILARMILHPDIQAKAQAEIDVIVGESGRQVSDSDLSKLPYLRAIVKETLRMHPPGPLLAWARLTIHDTQIGTHFIPAGTTAMVNMWAITHDEKVWPEAHEYKPDRFLGAPESGNFPIMGSDLRLAPFGAGRRVCPGKSMGIATVELWLAQLLGRFKWVPCGEVDLSETLKLSLEMKNPLVCKAIPRV
ncbi:cytochrome P450 78A5-like [Brassica rapa]|uniref:Cytochrome P450 78A5 n=1 Tax=Brassica campestris TaxID=3711 RepID=M4CV87_BRACM|nr:cytochrome P450 78A5-like [Brassica rapa]XP_009128028.1 cytochrome P450 78A5-like [Brassica rapa]